MSTIDSQWDIDLIAATSNEDADPDVVRLLLERHENVHYRLRAKSMKWKLIHHVAKISSKMFNTSNGLLKAISIDSGATALHYAALRGDMEVVELLLVKVQIRV